MEHQQLANPFTINSIRSKIEINIKPKLSIPILNTVDLRNQMETHIKLYKNIRILTIQYHPKFLEEFTKREKVEI